MAQPEIQDTVYGAFSSKLKVSKLVALCVPGGVQTGPFGSQLHQEDYVPNGTPIITVEHLDENRIRHDDVPMVSDEDRNRLSRYHLKKGDIVFSRVGSVDRRSLVREAEDGWLFSGRCLRVRPDNSKIDSAYLSYFFGLPSFKEHIKAIAVGATMPSLNTQILSDVAIVYPEDVEEQKRIAHILGTLDDKIELNRKMNATLEAMARALFKSWFVDFDPVRAKMEGRQPEGMDAEMAALFPDELVKSELGLVPKGWEVRPIGEAVECVGGSTPSTAEPSFWDDGLYHWATPKDTSSIQSPVLIETDRKITDSGLAKISSGLLPAGTLLMSSRAPVGYLAISAIPVAINQGFIAMKCNERASNYFILNWCQENMDEIKARATGTTFAEISKANFRPILFVIPSEGVMKAFTAKVTPVYSKIELNLNMSNKLAASRDSLLVKLVGQGNTHLI